jgi:hypothetical protein
MSFAITLDDHKVVDQLCNRPDAQVFDWTTGLVIVVCSHEAMNYAPHKDHIKPKHSANQGRVRLINGQF